MAKINILLTSFLFVLIIISVFSSKMVLSAEECHTTAQTGPFCPLHCNVSFCSVHFARRGKLGETKGKCEGDEGTCHCCVTT
ncbi:hypothetical protein MKX01_008113 [Papaver californicum]|nr:hypothetical protein MKX01_008113 [Papaver californicum]